MSTDTTNDIHSFADDGLDEAAAEAPDNIEFDELAELQMRAEHALAQINEELMQLRAYRKQAAERIVNLVVEQRRLVRVVASFTPRKRPTK